MFYVLVFFLGASIASFLQLVADRLPRREGIVWGGSHCDHCQAPLRAWDLVPVLSYVWRRGACSTCSQGLAWTYPLIEALGGGLALGLWFVTGGQGPQMVSLGLLLAMLLVLSLMDLAAQEIYLVALALPCMMQGLVLGFAGQLNLDRGLAVLFGLALFGWIYGGSALFWGREALGLGDVFVFMGLGLWFDLEQLFLIARNTFLLAGAGALGLLAACFILKKPRPLALPLVPFIGLAVVAQVFWGGG